ncbi:alpha/beta hydrolase [Duganella sp. BuS-21]|uniref:alpha/beta hydrolase n=1 Tax=Duganella sp. BuS-21 TaxID=2943848 RepID=UPI0035A58CC2
MNTLTSEAPVLNGMIPLSDAAPDMRPLLAAFRQNGGRPFHQLPLFEGRKNYVTTCELNGLTSEPVASVETVRCPVDNGSIALRLYRGMGVSAFKHSPVILFIHGGGWVIGNLESHDALCRHLANSTGSTVVAVDYRLAPEHKFPVPLNDCRAALAHLAKHASRWRLDLSSLVIAGDSAGGNMTTLLASRAELRPTRITVAAQVLLYPVTDLSASSASYGRVSSGFPLTADTMFWFRSMYAAEDADFRDPLLSPLFGPDDLTQPPMFIVTVGLDPLADEGIAYAAKAAAAGCRVLHHHLPQHMHGIFTSAGKVATARAMLTEAAAFILASRSGPASLDLSAT